jgi:VCBS repeat-containing protein
LTIVTVNSSAGLLGALKVAHGGDTILLAGGTYSNVSISGYNKGGVVTITSQSISNQATFTSLSVTGSTGLSFSNVKFNATASTAYYPFTVNASSNISLSGITAYGSSSADISSGLSIVSSSNVSVTGSKFLNLSIGIMDEWSNNIVMSNNSFSQLGNQGVESRGSSNMTLQDNRFTDFETVDGHHPEAFMFFTTGTTTSARNILVSGNTITQGTGNQIQGIFVQDEVGTLPFVNMTISNNTILGGQWNGIDVQGASNLVVSNNSLTSLVDPSISNSPLSRISLQYVSSASVTNNTAAQYIYDTTDSGLALSNNLSGSYVTALGGALSASAAVSGVAERQSVSGALTLNDIVGGNPYVSSVSGAALPAGGKTFSGLYGKLTMHTDGTYSYMATAEGLTVGKIYADNFTTGVTDSHGATTKTVVELTVTGSATGNGGVDKIVGGAGTETISGFGAGSTLTSGTGPDTFAFANLAASPVASHTTIQGFKLGDTIDLSAVDPSFAIVGAFDNHAHELMIVNDGAGAWDIYGDTTGAGVANFQIHLTGVTTPISAANFHL